MGNVNIHSSPKILEFQENLEKYSKAAELAWEYCNRVRHGEQPNLKEFRGRLQDSGGIEEFDLLIGIHQFVEHSVEHEVTKDCV